MLESSEPERLQTDESCADFVERYPSHLETDLLDRCAQESIADWMNGVRSTSITLAVRSTRNRKCRNMGTRSIPAQT